MLLLLCCCCSAMLSAAVCIVVVRLRLALAWWEGDGETIHFRVGRGRKGDRAARHNLIEAAHTSYIFLFLVVVVVNLVTADNTHTHTHTVKAYTHVCLCVCLPVNSCTCKREAREDRERKRDVLIMSSLSFHAIWQHRKSLPSSSQFTLMCRPLALPFHIPLPLPLLATPFRLIHPPPGTTTTRDGVAPR